MGRAMWLPHVLRSTGLTVHEQPGWQTRGSATFDPYGVIIHATAGRLTIDRDIFVLLNGSATAPPPIAQLFLARTGEWWVIASGRCNHALQGRAGNLVGLGNSRLIGIEAANDNRGEAWPDVQYESYARGVAAICKHLGWGTNRISGHKEHQPGDKSDPTFPMVTFRARVAQYMAGQTPQEEDMTPLQATQLQNCERYLQALVQMKDPAAGISDTVNLHEVENEMVQALNEIKSLLTAGGGDPATAAVLARLDAIDAKLDAHQESRRKAAQAAAIVFDDDPANDPNV